MAANTGTYLDSPFHRWSDGADLSGLRLESLANLPAVCVRIAAGVRAIEADVFQAPQINGKAVLVHTGWAQHFGTEQYANGHPYLTEAAAVYLRDSGAALVGIDSLNIDDTSDGHRPVHTHLLRASIPIVEHMQGLENVPDNGFRFFAVPPKVRAFGTFPVRAFALV
jgi:kynurenine formamidase